MKKSARAETLLKSAEQYILAEQWEPALRNLHRGLKLTPANASAWINCGMVLEKLGRPEEAATPYRQALAVDPDNILAINNLANLHTGNGEWTEAIALYEQALTSAPLGALTHNNLGVALLETDRLEEAEAHIRVAIEHDAGNATYLDNLVSVLLKAKQYDSAGDMLLHLLERQPVSAARLLKLAQIRHSQRRHDEALVLLEQVLVLDAELAGAHATLGRIHQELGNFDVARHHLRQVIALEPTRLVHYLNLVHITTLQGDDPITDALINMRSGIVELDEQAQIAAHFSLGKVFSDMKMHEASFEHFLAGNRLRRRTLDYNERGALDGFSRIRANMTADMLARWPVNPANSVGPVFIVGMPRSGSTLVEQILSQHPSVWPAGESDALPLALQRLRERDPDWRYPTPNFVPCENQLARLASDYLEMLSRDTGQNGKTSGAVIITDKMLSNFCHIGLITRLFPKAKIIHCFRDPIDSCLSAFSINFSTQPFTYDLRELGHYYRAYALTMRHWRSALPPGTVFDVRYEAVVQNFEESARAIITFCGLEWDDACLRFYEAKRPVMTASVEQVRRPIYTTSLKRWRPDNDILKPLYDGLGLVPPPPVESREF